MGEAVPSGEEKAMGMEEDERGSCKDGSSSVVRWERFLPSMVVRVLLVESDDSTRQIISALLRKCNYKVAAVADGLRVWEVLKERSRSFDLILTEIDLPSISGFALLSLIAEDNNCKNIPVIIMSSHDSIGTVHKCMMRGAADFLMKPIRINELKNLWQHVWRRQSCQSAIGCGLSLQVESAAQLKVDEATAENDAETLRQNEDACFKKGSDAQSSCTNRSLEARSGYAEEESQGLSRTKNLNSPVSDDMDLQDDEGSRKNLCTRSDEDLGKSKCQQGGNQQGHSLSGIGNDRAESCREAIDLIGAFGNKCSNNGPKIIESSELNLSWGGFQLTGPESNTGLNKVLIHSNVSAFSRYNNKQSQLLPIESTMNAVEGLSIHVRESKEGSSTYNRSVVSLPMHYREEPEVALSHEQQRRDADSSKHFGLDCAIFHEQRFMCTSNGNVNPAVDFVTAASENGNVDERFLPLDKRNLREAALMKFRLKRKERCYEKKVRYESRKKLADQRPRVKGQFVRRIPPDPPPRHPEVDYASVGG